MITTLRKRTRADRFVNDVRGQQRRRIGRWVYLTLVAVFFAWLLNAFVGPKLHDDGMPPVADRKNALVHERWPYVSTLCRALRERGKDIELGNRGCRLE
jgi:heme/copper-type cytochrome/quinol oxidase subunit 3